MTDMRVLVVGLGSMGKRRVRNLTALGIREIVGFDPRADRRAEAQEKYGIPTVETFELGLAAHPTAVVISTPPDLHAPYALRAMDAGRPFFTEASVPDDRLRELASRVRASGVIGMPSCTMRFYPGPRRVKNIVTSGRIGKPLAWVYHTGQYLPDWHPWESIQSFYVSNRSTGACREIVPFELVWLVDVFGAVSSVMCQKEKLTDLPVDIDDIYQLQLRHDSGVMGQLTVDVIARAPVRSFRVIGSEGVVEWDGPGATVRTYSAATREWHADNLNSGTVEHGYVNPEEPYIAEMKLFLRCVREGTEPTYTYGDDLTVLEVLLAAEESAAQHASVPVGERAVVAS